MIDVVPLNLDRLDLPYDHPIFPPHFNNTPANTYATTMPTQPILNIPASYGFDLTGELSNEVARPSLFDVQNWSAASLIMTFHQQFPHLYQLSDQNQSSSQQSSNEMATANSFSGQQQYSDVDNSSQHIQPSLESPSYVEPTVNYSYASTSTTSNSMNNLDNNNLSSTNNNKYPSRNLYYGNYPHHHPYLDHSYHNYPTSHSPQLINNYHLRHRIFYQGSPPPYGRKLSSGPIDSNIPNVSYSRPENVTTTASLPTTNLNLYYPTGNAIVPSFDISSTILTTKAVSAPTTIAIPQNSTNSVTSSTESESPTKKTYSYSGPPKSYYSRLPLYDRPFKCDTCPQSFNRNHDLKRHKRIHLAVKPYPCPYCEKQFSRKDALKRHIMVKGCNNNTANNKKNNNNNNKSVEDESLTNSSGQKYESIESERPIKSEPTNDNNVHNNYI